MKKNFKTREWMGFRPRILVGRNWALTTLGSFLGFQCRTKQQVIAQIEQIIHPHLRYRVSKRNNYIFPEALKACNKLNKIPLLTTTLDIFKTSKSLLQIYLNKEVTLWVRITIDMKQWAPCLQMLVAFTMTDLRNFYQRRNLSQKRNWSGFALSLTPTINQRIIKGKMCLHLSVKCILLSLLYTIFQDSNGHLTKRLKHHHILWLKVIWAILNQRRVSRENPPSSRGK